MLWLSFVNPLFIRFMANVFYSMINCVDFSLKLMFILKSNIIQKPYSCLMKLFVYCQMLLFSMVIGLLLTWKGHGECVFLFNLELDHLVLGWAKILVAKCLGCQKLSLRSLLTKKNFFWKKCSKSGDPLCGRNFAPPIEISIFENFKN